MEAGKPASFHYYSWRGIMRIKLLARPQFGGELYGIQFVEGVSTEHVPKFMFEKFDLVLGGEPVYISDDEIIPCKKCEEYKQIIADLKKKAKQ